MERSSYNRGGYKRSRDGRDYGGPHDGGGAGDDYYPRRGGRDYGGAEDVGRGGYGGGPSADYYPRVGSRDYGGAQDVGRGGDVADYYPRGSGRRDYGGVQDEGRGGDVADYYPRGGRRDYGVAQDEFRGRDVVENYPRGGRDVVENYPRGGRRDYVGEEYGSRGGGSADYFPRGGSRDYGGEQDVGRSRDGASYYPRGGDRNRNYPHSYGKQHQEHYGGGGGGGRRRVSDDVGGGERQSYRTPSFPNRAPDRSGRDREARSSLGSGQSVEPPPQKRVAVLDRLTQEAPRREIQSVSSPPKRVLDRLTHEVPRREIQSIPSPMDDSEAHYTPIRRPDHGTLALKSVKLLVNHFPVKFDPSTAILRYDIDVKHDSASASRSIKKPIPKPDMRLIQEKLCTDHPDKFPLRQTAYDGEKNIYSAILLPEETYTVELFGRSYSCTIKYGNKLGLLKLQDFLSGNAMQVPRDVLQALDVVMKANLYREKVSVGKGMYPRVHRKEDDLHGGVAAYRGSQQSLKITSNGLVMCVDYSAVPFRKRMPVIDFLKECIREIRDVNDIGRCEREVIRALKGLRVSVTHRRTNQKYVVCGLSDKETRDISFVMEDLEGKKEPEVIMLTDYFRDKWGKDIVHKGIPCLNLGSTKKPNYVPIEFCFLAEDKRFPKEQLGKEAARRLKELSLLNPDARGREICGMVRDEYASGKNGAEAIKNFEVEVGMKMTEVDGRVMAPPELKLGSSRGKMIATTVDRLKCHWNLLQGKTLVAGKAAERWAVIDFSRDDRWNSLNVNHFVNKLMNRCESIGINMQEPIMVHRTNMREFTDISKLTRLLKQVVEECRRIDNGRLQMIFCVMAEKHDGYKYLKWVSETQIGVITQCCLSQNANKANDQFLANLGMKINAKLGGSNVELIERFPRFDSDDHFMFIGADVNHPAAANQSSPSVAAVVGSVNWPAATRYAARVSPQPHRKEEIVNFGSLCVDLVNAYFNRNGVKPNRIVVFRDGVSDAQFDMVLNKEMVDMKRALYDKNYRPAITFVVAQKRHTTRLFLNDRERFGNVPPGTVVDTTIVQPFEFDFYLCSHFGGMGTSKPTHYSVIWDESGFTSDEMQKLVYHLCYTFARCTKPVSLVPPVYYADLVAYRGRMFQEVAAEEAASGGGMEGDAASFDQFFYKLEHHLEDSMFFI